MSPSVAIMLIAVVVVGVALLVVIAKTHGRSGPLDQEKYRVKWLEIENGLDKNNLATYQFAVLAADKLLDLALKESGIRGETMGERLKNIRGKLGNINEVWAAHKLRNQIAHEPDSGVNLLGAKRALATYRKSLKELGAI